MHPDLKIEIPRKPHPQAHDRLKPYWDLVRAHGGSRKSMVDFICGIGGYSDHRGFRSAIEFNIKVYGADLTVENLWKLLCSGKIDVGPEPSLPPEHMALAKALFWRVYEERKDSVWDWGVEEAYEGWADSDTPYETWLGERVQWEWEVHGRSGGHLCMTECEGWDLQMSPEDLETVLMERDPGGSVCDWYVPHRDLRSLFIICVQNTVEITRKKLEAEVEYRAAWRLWVSFCEDELPQLIEQYEKRQELGQSARQILSLLEGQRLWSHVEDFKAICQLADIKIEE